MDQYQSGAAIRAASIVTEQHIKNKVFNFAEDAYHPVERGLLQIVRSPRSRQPTRGGVKAGGLGERVNLHNVATHISRSPMARLHSAKNIFRRENTQALMVHGQDSGLEALITGEDVSSFRPDEQLHQASAHDPNQDQPPQLHRVNSKAVRESIVSEPTTNLVQARRTTLMEQAKKIMVKSQVVPPIGTSAQRSANPNAGGGCGPSDKIISPQKGTEFNRLQNKSPGPPMTQSKPHPKMQGEGGWFIQSGKDSSSSQQRTGDDQSSSAGVIKLPNLLRRKSKMSSTMSAYLEDAGQKILDSSLNQSFTLSQTNYQEMQHNALLYGGQSQIRESSADFWKSASNSQTSAPIAKLQSERQSQPKEKLESVLLTKQDRQQTMTTKKTKPGNKITKDHHELSLPSPSEDHHVTGNHHHKQQSMDITKSFKDKNAQKKPKGRDKKTTPSLTTEELKEPCLTERASKAAAGSSTTSAATQNRERHTIQTPGQQKNNRHHYLAPKRICDSIVSNQTIGGGSSGSQRSRSSQNDIRSGKITRSSRAHLQSNHELSSTQQTPTGAYFSISRQLVPSNSSLPPDSEVEEYQSMWADISKSIDRTNESTCHNMRDGDSYVVDVDEEELSGYQHLFNQSLCPSNYGQQDQNSSFQTSQSQDLDSSFYVSETNSTWAKSDRNSQYLKSQHSQSTFTKQGAVTGGQTSGTQTQQPSQQSYHPRHSTGLEESKTSTGQNLFSHISGGVSTTHKNQSLIQQIQQNQSEERISPIVSAQASPSQKYASTSQQQKRASQKQQQQQQPLQQQQDGSGGLTGIVANKQLQTSMSKQDHQNVLQRSLKHQQSASTIMTVHTGHSSDILQNQAKQPIQPMQTTGSSSGFDVQQLIPQSSSGKQEKPERHSSFGNMEQLMLTNLNRGNQASLALASQQEFHHLADEGPPLKSSSMMIAQDHRAQMSQSVQPTSSRNNTANQMVQQSVPSTPFLAQSLHSLQGSRYDCPSPSSAVSYNANSVSAFSASNDYHNQPSGFSHHHGPPYVPLQTHYHHVAPQTPHIAQLNQQLVEIQRFYEVERVPVAQPEFEALLGQIRSIPDLHQRQLAQEDIIFRMQKLLEKQRLAQRQAGHPAFDHRRDYSSSSSASKISSSSHHSSVSSQHRSSHQNNLKLALAQAFAHLEKLQTPEETTAYLIQKVYLFAKDKRGYKLLENKIDEEVFQLQASGCQSQFVDDLFTQLLSCSESSTGFHKLMMHQVANFFCQELFKQASKRHLEGVLEAIKNDFCKIAADMHGTRALQVLLEDELIKNDKRTEQTSVILHETLKNGKIFELSCNIRGNHVLRQCLVLLRTDERRSIVYEPIMQQFALVAKDKHGCQVVKDCITTAQGQWKQDLIRVSSECIENLINDEFGNFVIQAILEHFSTISKRKQKMDVRVSCFYEFIRLNLGKLCKQQYSSRVVEKAVETMPKEQFEKVCTVFLKNSTKKCKMFKDIMLDSFGNYIAPKILERTKLYNLAHYDNFKQIYRDSVEALKKIKHGRQLMGKMNQIVQQSVGKSKGAPSPTRQNAPPAGTPTINQQ